MEQVPNIAMFLHESRPNFPAAFSRYLVPIVVRYLTDPNNQVGFKFITFLADFYNEKDNHFWSRRPSSTFLLGVHFLWALFSQLLGNKRRRKNKFNGQIDLHQEF